MADNLLYHPELNPVLFFDEDRATSDEFQTPHFEDFPFDERGKWWLQVASEKRIWQITDIIELQFESMFDPIIIVLEDENGSEVISLPALIGLPHKVFPNTWSFDVSMSLAGLTTGCYRLKRVLGSAGPTQKTQYSPWMFISADPIPDTIFIKYWHSHFHKDVMFETGKKFGIRIPGWIDYDKQKRVLKQEVYKDQRLNPALLQSDSARNIPVYFGDEFGLTADDINLIEQIWECDNVEIDNKPFGLAEAKFEYIELEGYRKRGLHTIIEPGINRQSRVFGITTDTSKKLVTTILVDNKVVGDFAGSGSTNTVPFINAE